MNLLKSLLLSVALLLVALAYSACGSGLDGSSGISSKQSLELSLDWPESAFSGLGINGAEDMARAPSYITSIGLVVTGSDMDPIKTSISTSTLKTTVNLTFGKRRFSVVAKSAFGNFTGSSVATISRNGSPNVSISMEANAPPKIRITTSSRRPVKGKQFTATVEIDDPDTDDRHKIAWVISGPKGTRVTSSAKSISFTPKWGGKYRASVQVDDGHGGVDNARHDFTISSGAPVITNLTYSKQIVKPGDWVTLTCSATDPDKDKLKFRWEASTGQSATGRTLSFKIPTGGPFTISCIATDGDPDTKDATKDLKWDDIKVDFAIKETSATNYSREVDVFLKTPVTGNNESGTSTTCNMTPGLNYTIVDTLRTGGFDLSSAGEFTIILRDRALGGCIGTPASEITKVRAYRSGQLLLNKQKTFNTARPNTKTYTFTP